MIKTYGMSMEEQEQVWAQRLSTARQASGDVTPGSGNVLLRRSALAFRCLAWRLDKAYGVTYA